MEFTYKDFGRILERARMQKNMTQRDLEELTGGKIKQPAISEMENGHGGITLERFIDICNYLKVRPEELLDPYLKVPLPSEHSEAIVDLYVIQVAELLEGCPSDLKETLVEVIECFIRYHKKNCIDNNTQKKACSKGNGGKE